MSGFKRHSNRQRKEIVRFKALGQRNGTLTKAKRLIFGRQWMNGEKDR